MFSSTERWNGCPYTNQKNLADWQRSVSNAPILVVEDQTDLRLIVVHQLRKMTYSNVVQATNGYEAIERMNKHLNA